ncbi:unnamed protein product [Anisakis simplex]|uniref:Col_cuticle_N domain-containing protein n=1 Tax=Anisakis simplex TaxID=6269 RepID=A0A0M3JQJ4_ANISI|nr:unnamed protein product [Anisakis simplex]
MVVLIMVTIRTMRVPVKMPLLAKVIEIVSGISTLMTTIVTIMVMVTVNKKLF